jgi:hypothetical protein
MRCKSIIFLVPLIISCSFQKILMNDRKKKHSQANSLASAASVQKMLGFNSLAKLNYAIAGSLEMSAGNGAQAIHHYAQARSVGAHSSDKTENKKEKLEVKVKKVEQKSAADEGLRRSERLKVKSVATPVIIEHKSMQKNQLFHKMIIWIQGALFPQYINLSH